MIYNQRIKIKKWLTTLITICFVLSFICVFTWASIVLTYLLMPINHLFGLENNTHLITISFLAIMLISVIITIKSNINQLKAGGLAIAKRVEATEVTKAHISYPYRRLRNIVEEISVASRLPVPKIYVMENEQGINAFVAGHTPDDAVLVVTNGALKLLNRNELQAVIAHEFSHILNGDMSLNIQMVAWLAGVSIISDIGYAMFRYYWYVISGFFKKATDTHDFVNYLTVTVVLIVVAAVMSVPTVAFGCIFIITGFVVFFGCIFIITGFVGNILNNLLRALINRQREYIADLNAVGYLRYNAGLISVLKKIAGIKPGSTINRTNSGEISHFFFSLPSSTPHIISSHPSIIKRISALDPSFTSEDLKRLKQGWGVKLPDGINEDVVMGFATLSSNKNDFKINDDIRSPEYDFKRLISASSNEISPFIIKYTRTADGVIPLVFSLVLSDYAQYRFQQVSCLQGKYNTEVGKTALKLFDEYIKMNIVQRFPIALMCKAGLHKLQQDQLDLLMQTIDKLISLDEDRSLSLYFTGIHLKTEIADICAPISTANVKPLALNELSEDISQLIAIFVSSNSLSVLESENAFKKAIAQLFPTLNIPMPVTILLPSALDSIWPKLFNLEYNDKVELVDTLATLIYADGRMHQHEAEIIYTLCRLLRVRMISEIKTN